MNRVLLIGGSGQLGTAIRRRWTDWEITAPPHDSLRIEHGPQLQEALQRLRPDVLINAAAFHDVDRCESEPERALEVNAIAVGRAARLARDYGATFVTLSTDYVFDGCATDPYSEADAPRPLSVYGVSKVAGEYLTQAAGGQSFVVRTCGLYGASTSHGRPRFVQRLLSQNDGPPMRVVADVYVSPTFAGDLADALRGLLRTQAYGLYHAVNGGPVSWYDFARETVRQAGVAVGLERVAAADWKTSAVRPRYSALSNAKLAELGIAMPSWSAGIAAFLKDAVR